jgi:hypothetical protein
VTIDIKMFAYRDEATMPIVPPGHGRPIGTVTFCGPGTEQGVNSDRENYRMGAHFTSRGRAETFEAWRTRTIERITSRIVRWELMENREDGENVETEFTKSAARRLLGNPSLGWFVEQCAAFLNNPVSFAAKGST